MSWSNFKNFSDVFGWNEILFESFGSKTYSFQRFRVHIRNILKFLCTKLRFQNVLCRDSILFGCFESKEDTFEICWVEFRYISNYFGTKRDTFQMFWVEIRFFSNVFHQIQYYSNVLLKNSILLGWFASKSDTYPLFWTKFG